MKKYLYETHVHTAQGSKCGQVDATEMARRYHAAGYTGIVITDHFVHGNTAIDRSLPWEQWVEQFCRGYELAKAEGDKLGLQVFFGWESGYKGTEFLILGLDKAWLLAHPEIRDCTVQQQYELVHQGGGIVIHAHPYRVEPYIPEIRLFPEYVDAVEVYNATHSSLHSKDHRRAEWNKQALAYAREHKLPITAGSDQHKRAMIGGGMVFQRKMETIRDLCQAILNEEAIAYLDGSDPLWQEKIKDRQYCCPKYPNLLHGADYNPEQWVADKEQIWNEDMRLMKLANCNEMSIGIFSWSTLEPREGEYHFEFLDEILDKVHENGGKVILATPSAARPRWLAEKYPEVLRVNHRLEREHYSLRHNHCMTSPVYRQKVAAINQKLAQRYGDHPAVIGWHISNEYGGECRCPLCQQAFRDYLREKYDHDIEKLNHAYWSGFWSHRFDDFKQVEAPSDLTDQVMHGLNLDWHRFMTHQTKDFIKHEIAAVRAGGSDLPTTINMMWSLYELDYNEFADVIDIASWDSYPRWHTEQQCRTAAHTAFQHDFYRSMKQKPFLLMESAPGLVNWHPVNKLKRPGMDKLQAMQAVAHGADSVQYFQFRKSRGSVEKFHGAIVDHVGTEHTRIFKTVQEIGATLQKINELAGSHTHSRVALVYDWDCWWALDDAQCLKNPKRYPETCMDYHNYFWNRGISVDIISKTADFHKYDLVILPMMYLISQQTMDKIDLYVREGGVVYATYTLGMVNETDLCYLGGFPGGKLKDIFGIWNEEVDALYDADRVQVEGLDDTFEGVDLCELIHANGAQVLARYSSQFYAGMPALTVNAYGQGLAYYQAFRDTGAFKAAALDKITADLGIEGVIPGCGNGITAHARYADDTMYLFVENYNDHPTEQIVLGDLFTDMESGEQVQTVSLPPFSVRILKKTTRY